MSPLSVVVVGIHERDASLDLLERVAVAERDVAKVLGRLGDSPHLSEAVVLSTCMRTEVYAVLERFHDGLADIQGFFESRLGDFGPGVDKLDALLTVAYDDAAARHLFEVAAGVDSAVLGEGEVLRQVRDAAKVAHQERASGPVLGGLFRHATEVGKRARSETGIARGTTSLSYVAVAMAAGRLGGTLAGRRVLVVGAGEVAEGIVESLGSAAEAPEIVVANRSPQRANALAASVGGRAVELGSLVEELAAADVLLTATAADEILIDEELVQTVLGHRSARPLVIVDAAMPRDVDPAVGRLPGVTLFDVAALGAFAETEMAGRRAEVARVEAIIDEELERYQLSARARSVSPVVVALRAKAEAVRLAELERLSSRLASLDPEDREAVEALTRRIVAKLLHEPTVELKQAAGSPRGERLAEAARSLFGL